MEQSKPEAEAFVILYKVIGRQDGRWVVRAYDRNEQPIGNEVIVQTPGEAWKVLFMLNGYHYADPFPMELRKAG